MRNDIRNSLLVRALESRLSLGGSSVRIASAIGFVKASIDITQTHDSLLLGAKAILASRLALNTLPKVPKGSEILTIIGLQSVFPISPRSSIRCEDNIIKTNRSGIIARQSSRSANILRPHHWILTT